MQHQCSNELRDPHIKHRSNKRTNLSSETSHFYTPYRIAVHMQHIFAHINAERAFGLSSFQKQPVWFSIQAVFVRAVPASNYLREPAARTVPAFAAHAAGRLLIRDCSQRIALRRRNKNARLRPANVTGAHSIKVLIELFQKFAGRGEFACKLIAKRASALVAIRRSRNSPAFCFGKKEAWRKFPFSKGQLSPFSIASAKRILL